MKRPFRLTIGGMFSKLTTFTRKAAKTEPETVAQNFVIEPEEEAKVNRLENGRYHIQWQRPTDTVTIYASPKPYFDEEARLWATITGAQDVVVPSLPNTLRPFFILEFSQNDSLIVGERFLPMPNTFNFRDIGGYRTKDGKQIRWGQVFRSGDPLNFDRIRFRLF